MRDKISVKVRWLSAKFGKRISNCFSSRVIWPQVPGQPLRRLVSVTRVLRLVQDTIRVCQAQPAIEIVGLLGQTLGEAIDHRPNEGGPVSLAHLGGRRHVVLRGSARTVASHWRERGEAQWGAPEGLANPIGLGDEDLHPWGGTLGCIEARH